MALKLPYLLEVLPYIQLTKHVHINEYTSKTSQGSQNIIILLGTNKWVVLEAKIQCMVLFLARLQLPGEILKLSLTLPLPKFRTPVLSD